MTYQALSFSEKQQQQQKKKFKMPSAAVMTDTLMVNNSSGINIYLHKNIALDNMLFSTKKYWYFLISWRKHMLWVLFRSSSDRRF